MSRGAWEIRRCRKERDCTEQSYHRIQVGDLYLYGAEPPESDVNTPGVWRIWAACLRCVAEYHLHTDNTRKQLEEARDD